MAKVVVNKDQAKFSGTLDITGLTPEEYGMVTAAIGKTYTGLVSLYGSMRLIAIEHDIPHKASDFPRAFGS